MIEHTTNPAAQRDIFAAGLVGILASVLVGTAEFSLHFTPTLNYGGEPYQFFIGTSASRLTFGHFLAIFATPLYFFGYWHLFQRLKPAPTLPRLAVLVLGIYSVAVGAIWIGSRVYPAILVQALHLTENEAARQQLQQLLDRASFYNETILLGLRIGILILSALLVALVVSGKTSYPRWFALFNPILIVLLCFLLYFLVPSIGGYVMPIAMNVAHLLLFGVSTILMAMAASKP